MRILLLGDKGVGKTSLVKRIDKNMSKSCNHYNIDTFKSNRHTIYDTTGPTIYDLNVDLYIVIFDVNDLHSFYSIYHYLCNVHSMLCSAKLIILGNKIDKDDIKVNKEDLLRILKD